MIKGVIFDYNGTLYPDDDLQDIAWKQTINKYFPEIENVDEILKTTPFINNNYVLNYLTELVGRKHISKEEIKRMSYDKETIYRNLCIKENRNQLMPGADKLLDYLKNNGYKINICSSSIKPNIDFFVINTHLDKWFDPSIISYDNEKVLNKEEMYKDAINKLNLLPEDCLVFEDSIRSINDAIKIGVRKIVKMNHFNKQKYMRKEILQEIKDFNELNYSIFKE